MKIKELLFGMLACTALAGCSNDNDPVNNEDNGLSNSYMAVKIADATRSYTRATDGYDEGVGEERKIANADFFFYASDGRFIALVEKTFDGQNTSTGNVSDKAQMLVLEKTQLQPKTLITLVNNPIEASSLRGLSLDEMKAKIAEIGDIENYAEDNTFFMTCSSYYDGESVVYGTDVEGKLQATEDAAGKAPVDVYVERVAAKTTVNFKASSVEIGNQIVDETPQTLVVTLKGWGLNGTNKNSYVVKNLSNVDFTTYGWAKATTDFRSYWAVDDNYTTGAGKYATIYKDLLEKPAQGESYSDETINEGTFSLDYISANEATLTTTSAYCLENTSNILLETGKANPYTTVTIIAEVALKGNAAATIYKYQGAYYTETSMKNLALKALADYRKASGDEYIPLEASDISVVDAWADTNNEVKFEVSGTAYFDNAKTPAGVEVSVLNAKLAALGNASCFNGGLCYYNVPIKHLGEEKTTENNGVYGVVRNHSYVLNVNSINNVGEAVYKPGAPIIPTITPTPEEFYLSTTLNVLSWKTVSQDVEL